jgi:dihydropteroate synthase
VIPGFFIPMKILQCGRYRLSLDRPLIMGIVNLTPDSFSNDGLGSDVERAVTQARMQIEAGADILDIGAESSRPGAIPTSADEDLRRLLPVLERVVEMGKPVSVDTYKPLVMREALTAGVSMINDINGLRHQGALDAVRESNCAICLMHMQGEPGTMQLDPVYQDVISEVDGFLRDRVSACLTAGIAHDRLVLDPGFGFGKSQTHNLTLFRGLTAQSIQDLPLLVGVSRKSMLGGITGRPVGERLAASIVAATLAVQKGANIVRVHDVAATKDALAVLDALGGENK